MPSLRLTFAPASAERWADIETLFGERGACGGCWCMWPRLTAKQFGAGKGEANKAALQARVAREPAPGILAYDGDRPIAWCALGPRAEMTRLDTSRVLKPVDEQPVWSVVCFFVAKPYRRRGISARVLKEAARYAKSHGAAILEGYPVDPTAGPAPDAFVWTGLPGSFLAAGFTEVLRRSPTRPIMRLALGRSSPTTPKQSRRTSS